LEQALPTQEVHRLQVSDRCKRKAEENDVCRQSTPDEAHSVSFANVEIAVYKRRRLTQPTLPRAPSDADAIVRNSRYAKLNGDDFYHGIADAGEDRTALLFAWTGQLNMLKVAKEGYFDATFKIVPAIYYQLLTVFATSGDAAFPVCYVLMRWKTHALYRSVFAAMRDLVPDFTPKHVMADFEKASVGAFQDVFGEVAIAGCWFHYCQAVIKRLNKLGLKEHYQSRDDITDIVRYILGLPLLPAEDIRTAAEEIRATICTDMHMVRQLQQLLMYVQRQWIDKRTVGPERLSVRGIKWRTDNIPESYQAALRRRIQMSHPNLFLFLGHHRRATVDYMSDRERLENGLAIRRPRSKQQLKNDRRVQRCFEKYDNGDYSRIQFLRH